MLLIGKDKITEIGVHESGLKTIIVCFEDCSIITKLKELFHISLFNICFLCSSSSSVPTYLTCHVNIPVIEP